jgi:dephospho-CoA kinase
MESSLRQSLPARLVLGITGRIGAGKTSAAKHLSSCYGLQYMRYSAVLSEWFAVNPDNKKDLQMVGWEVMEKGLQSELNRRLIERIGHGFAVVDGLRHPLDYSCLAEAYGISFHLIYLDSPREARWEHLKGQGRYTSLDVLVSADSHPVEQQIEILRPRASLEITNDGSLSSLYLNLDATMKTLEKEGHL